MLWKSYSPPTCIPSPWPDKFGELVVEGCSERATGMTRAWSRMKAAGTAEKFLHLTGTCGCMEKIIWYLKAGCSWKPAAFRPSSYRGGWWLISVFGAGSLFLVSRMGLP